jgi:hypothetical protein
MVLSAVGVNSIRMEIGLSISVGPFSLVPLGTGAIGLVKDIVPGLYPRPCPPRSDALENQPAIVAKTEVESNGGLRGGDVERTENHY